MKLKIKKSKIILLIIIVIILILVLGMILLILNAQPTTAELASEKLAYINDSNQWNDDTVYPDYSAAFGRAYEGNLTIMDIGKSMYYVATEVFPKYYEDLKDAANDAGVWVQMLDFARLTNINYFSKYNTSLIWIYYNLWNFNFIVGFAGALSVFGIMVSIIIGLMMRLIKSAAMFLIYPPLLGLSPMDDFGAFKKWSSEFIKQILSAFGAIIGINLLFLILPFVLLLYW